MTQAKKRRIVTIEYDVTGLTPEQVDALLLDALVRCRDVSFKVEITPGVNRDEQ